MACGCGKRKTSPAPIENQDPVMGGYKYLTDRQIKARLENYKKRYCKACTERYNCNYVMYTECKKNN